MASIFGDDGVDDLLNENVQDENQELPSDDEHKAGDAENLFGEGEGADDQQPVKVEPKKRSVRNPRPRLTIETLRGPRGLHTIEEYYKDIKYKGKGHEREDLDEIMRRLQHWGHRMYPTYKFDDVLNNIETLGKKKTLQVHMQRYRLNMLENMTVPTVDGADQLDDEEAGAAADEPFDEFDALLGEQIAISKLAPRTPASNHSRYSGGGMAGANTSMASCSTFATPSFTRGNAVMSTPYTGVDNKHNQYDDSDLAVPLPPSQPSTPKQLSAEQIARIAENRRLAQERLRAKKLQQQQETQQLEIAEA